LADWNWKVVREFVQRRFSITLHRSSCLNYLHRLGFVLKRPKKRLVKADAGRRAAFVREDALLRAAAQASGGKLFFADEAHFYADVDLRGKWVLRGEPALVDSTSPRWGDKASYYSAVLVRDDKVRPRRSDTPDMPLTKRWEIPRDQLSYDERLDVRRGAATSLFSETASVTSKSSSIKEVPLLP